MDIKNSKGILKLTLSLIAMMLATEVFARGGGDSTGRSMAGSTVWGSNVSRASTMRIEMASRDQRGVPSRGITRRGGKNRQQRDARGKKILEEVIVEGKQYNFQDYMNILQDNGFTRVGAFGFILRNELKPKQKGEYITRHRGTCDQTTREFKVWNMYFREKKFDPKHERITIYWRDGIGVYRKNHKLPTSLIWTEISFRHFADRCNSHTL